MKRVYEVHRLRVEDTQVSTNVSGRISSLGENVSGRVDTTHSQTLFANGRAYSLVQTVRKLPIRAGDDLIVVCSHGRNGEWKVQSIFNRSNGTSYAINPELALFYVWGMFAFSMLLILLVIGFLLAPVMLFVAGRFTIVNLPQIRAANAEAGRLASVRDDGLLKRELDAFNALDAEVMAPFGRPS